MTAWVRKAAILLVAAILIDVVVARKDCQAERSDSGEESSFVSLPNKWLPWQSKKDISKKEASVAAVSAVAADAEFPALGETVRQEPVATRMPTGHSKAHQKKHGFLGGAVFTRSFPLRLSVTPPTLS